MVFVIHYVTNKIFKLYQLFVDGAVSKGRHKKKCGRLFQDDGKGSFILSAFGCFGLVLAIILTFITLEGDNFDIIISINLLVVYREAVNLIGYITRRLSADSLQF